jgi:hypothetical protein
LLAYLAVEADQPHSRDKLADLLWSEWPDRDARNNLHYALSNLRHAIGDRAQFKDRAATPPFLHISRQTIQFNETSDSWIDVTALTTLLEARRRPSASWKRRLLCIMASSWRGSLSPIACPSRNGCCSNGSSSGGRCLPRSTAWRRPTRDAASTDVPSPTPIGRSNWNRGREQAHRQLMRLLALNGQRGAALAQYETCWRALAEQLDIEPAQETTRLYEQIRDGTLDPGRIGEPGTGEVGVPLPPQAAETVPSPPALAQRPSAGWRTLGRRLIVVGGVLLLLVIATMEAITLFGAKSGLFGVASPETPSPPPPLAEPPDGKILHPCEGMTPPQICVYETRADQGIQVTHDPEFETIGRLSWSPDGEQIVFNAGKFRHRITGESETLHHRRRRLRSEADHQRWHARCRACLVP